jgi:hypothetical protein
VKESTLRGSRMASYFFSTTGLSLALAGPPLVALLCRHLRRPPLVTMLVGQSGMIALAVTVLAIARLGEATAWSSLGLRRPRLASIAAGTVYFIGGGREGRPKIEARDDDGKLRRDATGDPILVLARDDDGKALPGRGFQWSRRDLKPDERAQLVATFRAVADRLSAELVADVLAAATSNRQFDTVAHAYVEDARRELADREALVASIAKARQRNQY